jgi:hypothetical protein
VINPLGPNTSYFVIYEKNSGRNSNFTYKALPPAQTPADFLAQANVEAANGFVYQFDGAFLPNGPGSSTPPEIASIYMKDSAAAGSVSYEFLPPAANRDAFIAQLNNEGAKGFRWKVDSVFNAGTPSQQIVSLFVKNSSEGTYSYDTQTPAAKSADFVTQANAQGAKSALYYGDQSFGTSPVVIYSLYANMSRCKCRALDYSLF